MKSKFQILARKNGHLAKMKAGRVAVMLKLYQADPTGRHWLRNEAVYLSKSVAYHLRQAALIGSVIAQIEKTERQVKKIDNMPDTRTPRAPLSGARGKT